MSVKITESAAREFKKVIVEQQMPDTIALRVGVKGGGCSGFEYQLEFDNKVSEDADLLVEMHGVRVAVDKKSALYLDGTEIDFHESLDKRGFVFNNPNATKSCGCGSSFSA
jgi:iron-sulfur cluster assembly accessory protein